MGMGNGVGRWEMGLGVAGLGWGVGNGKWGEGGRVLCKGAVQGSQGAIEVAHHLHREEQREGGATAGRLDGYEGGGHLAAGDSESDSE